MRWPGDRRRDAARPAGAGARQRRRLRRADRRGIGFLRYLAVFGADVADEGAGAPFRVQYRLRGDDGETLAVEDFGRWFADAEGRPCRAMDLCAF